MKIVLTTRVAITATALVLGCLLIPSAASAGSPSPKPTISPECGTPAASPETQISIFGVKPKLIKSLRLTGSESGDHPGRMRTYSGHRGASFLPDQPLAQGERADLVVRIRGRKPIRSFFDVARQGPVLPFLDLTNYQQEKLRHYVSRPELIPPKIKVHKQSKKITGNVFLTPLPSPTVHPGSDNTVTINPVGPGGPMITNRAGQVVWFRQLTSPDVAANLQLQRYNGRKVLTWWQGGVTPWAYGDGEGIIANRRYRTVAKVKAGNGYPMDLHEFELTRSGDALFTIYQPIMIHLPGSPEGKLNVMLNSIIQRVDVKTGLVLWEWHSYGHIPLEESMATPEVSASYDTYHINSIQELRGGKILISARDTSALYKIDPATGKILWTLGGKASDFKLRKGTRFYFQHDARMLKDGRISLFDDQAGPPQYAPSSRGLVLKLNHRRKTASVAARYKRPVDTSAQSEGSVQMRPGGNVFVGFGAEPNFSEFSRGGKLLYDAQLPEDDGSYRIFRHPWRTTPKTRSVGAAKQNGSRISIYASWNGATTVARWQVRAEGKTGRLKPIKTMKKRGFETRINVSTRAVRFKVRALNKKGRTLSTSRAFGVTVPTG